MTTDKASLSTSKRCRESPFVWCLAVLAALVWHGAACWWIGLASTPTPLRQDAEAVVVRVTPAPRIDAGQPFAEDVDLLWSPIVFALPTDVGFSAQLLARHIDARPPLNASRESSMYLNRVKSDQRALTTTDVVPLGHVLRYDPMALRRDIPPGPSFQWAKNTTGRAHISLVQRDASLELLDAERFTISSEFLKDEAWDATASIVVDHGGAVQSVILEEGAGSPTRRTEIIRAIKQCRFNRGQQDRAALVRIYYLAPDAGSAQR